HSDEGARRSTSHTGIGRIAFAADLTPLPGLLLMLLRRGQSTGAWQQLEVDFARGLFDDLARPEDPEERHRKQEILARIQRLEGQITALASADRGRVAAGPGPGGPGSSARDEAGRGPVLLGRFHPGRRSLVTVFPGASRWGVLPGHSDRHLL
ncbi:MAG TPA: hypothetical protein VF590_11035, partial [Isosphaeraceae bacterium]